MNIRVTLPHDRTRPGRLLLLSDAGAPPADPAFRPSVPARGRVLLEAPCLGKADNGQALKNGNPDRDPVRPWGDTPTGTYRPAKVITFSPEHATLGRFAIALVGSGGQALEAMLERPDKPRRTELYIHATRSLDEGRGETRLIPTYGCLRLLDADMAALAALLGDQAVAITIDELQAAA